LPISGGSFAAEEMERWGKREEGKRKRGIGKGRGREGKGRGREGKGKEEGKRGGGVCVICVRGIDAPDHHHYLLTYLKLCFTYN